MKTIPIHPAYDGDNSPAKTQRTMLGSLTESSYVGDVTNAAKAFVFKRPLLMKNLARCLDKVALVLLNAKASLFGSPSPSPTPVLFGQLVM